MLSGIAFFTFLVVALAADPQVEIPSMVINSTCDGQCKDYANMLQTCKRLECFCTKEFFTSLVPCAECNLAAFEAPPNDIKGFQGKIDALAKACAEYIQPVPKVTLYPQGIPSFSGTGRPGPPPTPPLGSVPLLSTDPPSATPRASSPSVNQPAASPSSNTAISNCFPTMLSLSVTLLCAVALGADY